MRKLSAGPDEERVPVAAPNPLVLQSARDTLHLWKLHFYQVMYFETPKLASPGNLGPFTLDWCQQSLMLKVGCIRRPEYGFTILPCDFDRVSQEEQDKALVIKLRMIETAIVEGITRFHPRACCPLAVQQQCVCLVSFTCPIHGRCCIGSHD